MREKNANFTVIQSEYVLTGILLFRLLYMFSSTKNYA